MRRHLFSAAVALAVAAPGTALAQSGTTDATPGTYPGAPAVTSPGVSDTTASTPGRDLTPGLTIPDSTVAPPAENLGPDPRPLLADTAPIAPRTHAIVGQDIRNAQGDRIGTVRTLLVDNRGRVADVIVDPLEGDRRIRLDWERITITDAGEVESTLDQDELATLPEWEDDAE